MQNFDKLERLRRWHRQNVFNAGADGDRHERALRRLRNTATARAFSQHILEAREHRESETLLRMYA